MMKFAGPTGSALVNAPNERKEGQRREERISVSLRHGVEAPLTRAGYRLERLEVRSCTGRPVTVELRDQPEGPVRHTATLGPVEVQPVVSLDGPLPPDIAPHSERKGWTMTCYVGPDRHGAEAAHGEAAYVVATGRAYTIE